MRPLTRPTVSLLPLLLLTACPSEEPPDEVIVTDDDDDDTTAADDDDSTAADDDDSGDDDDDDDDDDSTPASFEITLAVDAPPGTIVAVQSGDGPFTEVTITDMAGSAVIDDPDGRYGVLLACAGAERAGVQVLLSDALTEPEVFMGCAEAAVRAPDDGLLAGPISNGTGDVWSLYLGTARWPTVWGTVSGYNAPLPLDNYDLVGVRRSSNGVPNTVLIHRVLDAAANPSQPVDWEDSDPMGPHVPEVATLDIDGTGAAPSTSGTFLSRGGSVVPLDPSAGSQATFEVISNERRFFSDIFLFDTARAHDADCTGRTLTILTSERMEDFNTAVARHGAPIVPVSPETAAACDELTGVAVSADATSLVADWTTGLAAGHTRDTLLLSLDAPGGATRWTVTADAGRPVASLDLAAVAAVLGVDYALPAAGWSWTATGYEKPVAEVTNGQLALVVTTEMFTSLPTGRSPWQFDPLPPPGANLRGERSHEYDDDDLTRVFRMLPWDEVDYSAHGIERRGAL